jgi:hypothetical protein
MRYTSPTSSLIFQPPESRIARVAARHGLKDLTDDDINFVLDAYNVGYGASPKPFDRDDYDLGYEALLHAEKRTSLSSYEDYFAEEFLKHQEQLHTVLANVNMEDIPGKDYLTKAVRLLKYVKIIEEKAEQFRLMLNLWRELQGALKQMAKVSNDTLAMLAPTGVGNGSGDNDDAVANTVMELALHSEAMLSELVRVARQLDDLSELNKKNAEPRMDPNGENVRIRTIKDYGEIVKAGQQVWGLPRRLRQYKAVTGQLDVREPITYKDRKQVIYILLDVSSSMLYDDGIGVRIGRAAGVIVNRLKAVMAGDAEVFLRCFANMAHEQEYYANSPKSAEVLLKLVTSPSFYKGGGTDFRQPLQVAGDRTKQLVLEGKLRDPEIVIITDGDSAVPEKNVLGGATLHSMQVGEAPVFALSQLAKSSGGIDLFVGA